MSVPGIVQSALGDEQVAARVGIGGEDELYVTPSRILIYRGEGLLSDEDVEEYTPKAERVLVKEGRRKGKIVLEHGLEGDRTFSVPRSRLDEVLHPVLAGVLNASGVTEPGETVKQTYRFSELTLIVTSRRLVKHIGTPVWDADYDEYHFENTTGLSFEQGSVATQIVIEVDGRRERIKAPNEEAPEVRAHLEEALFEFYDVADMAEFDAAVADDDADETPAAEESTATDEVAFVGGVAPLDAGGDDDYDRGEDTATGSADTDIGDDGFTDTDDASASASEGDVSASTSASGGDVGAGTATVGAGEEAIDELLAGSSGASEDGESASGGATMEASAGAVNEPSAEGEGTLNNEELTERLGEIARAVNKQNRLLERHQQTIEQLIEELQRMQD